MLHEIKLDKEKQIPYDLTYMCNLKKLKLNTNSEIQRTDRWFSRGGV